MINYSLEFSITITTDNSARKEKIAFHTNINNINNLKIQLAEKSASRAQRIAQNNGPMELDVAEISTHRYTIHQALVDIIQLSSEFNITELTIAIDKFDGTLTNHLFHINSLTHLIINYNLITDPAIASLAKLKRLTSITINSKVSLSSQPTLLTLDVKQWNNSNLKEINISPYNFSKETIIAIGSMPIKTLGIFTHDNVDNSTWAACINALAKNSHIKKLSISLSLHRNSFYFASLDPTIFKSLFANRNIQTLNLSCYNDRITNESLTGFEFNDSLESLSIFCHSPIASNYNKDLSTLINALAIPNSIRHLKLKSASCDEVLLIANLSRLVSLEVEHLVFINEKSAIDSKVSDLVAVFREHPILQKFRCPLMSYNARIRSEFLDRQFCYKTIKKINEALADKTQKMQTDLNTYLNKCLTFLRGFLNEESWISKLNIDSLKFILFEYAMLDDLAWKTTEQRIGFVECLTQGFFNNFTKNNFKEKFKQEHIVIQEKNHFKENRFIFFLEKNANYKKQKRSLEDETLEPNKFLCGNERQGAGDISGITKTLS